MPDPRSIGPVKPICRARSGDTTPMPTRRCFQMRLSVSSVSYSSTYFGKRLREVLDEVEQRPLAVLVQPLQVLLVAVLRRAVLRHGVRQVAVDAAGPVVGGVHARARHRLVHVHQVFALAEGVQEDRHRADVEAVRAEPQQVVQQARDLVEHHADVLRAQRAPRRRAASRSPSRTRARCTSSRRSRAGPCTAPTAGTCASRRASRSRGAAARCADRPAGSPRRRAPARGAARRARPDAAARN